LVRQRARRDGAYRRGDRQTGFWLQGRTLEYRTPLPPTSGSVACDALPIVDHVGPSGGRVTRLNIRNQIAGVVTPVSSATARTT
jgi:hypothetical protein